MHNNHFEAIALVQKLVSLLHDKDYKHVEVVVLPPFTDLRLVVTLVDGDRLKIGYGAQENRSTPAAPTPARCLRPDARQARLLVRAGAALERRQY